MLIDFHYHFADTPGALDELLKDMDASGVERTLLSTRSAALPRTRLSRRP
jgi:hypothetical protein